MIYTSSTVNKLCELTYCPNCYSFWASDTGLGGDSERVLGRWLAARPGVRERVLIATKLGAEPVEPGSWPDRREGLSARAVRAAFAGSLDRLGIERVDMLWLHQEDRSVPIEETVDALAGLAADRFGVSNHPAWLVERGRAHAQAIGAPSFDALQLNATYLRPRPGTLPPGVAHRFGVLGDEQADYAAEHGMDLWAYTPLLSGAYDNPVLERAALADFGIRMDMRIPGFDVRLALGEIRVENLRHVGIGVFHTVFA